MGPLSLPLADVTLRYTDVGEGPAVICVHGFPDDATTFRATEASLVAAGYRVACPTLRGYRPSGVAASGRYDVASLAGDVLALADHLSPDAPVRLVGHDWGAIAAFAAAAAAPEGRVSHLCTMAVPHLAALLRNLRTSQARRSWYIAFFQLPIVPELALAAGDFALVERLWRAWSPSFSPTSAEMEAVKAGLRGRAGAALGYYRALRSPRVLAGPARRWLFGPVTVPALHLHGAEDGCIGAECTEGAERFYRGPYRRRIVAGAGHFLPREAPAVVSEELLRFFQGEPSAPGRP